MKVLQKFPFIPILIGIAISLIVFTFIKKSPYTLALGPVIGILLGKPPTVKLGSLYGILIGAPVTFYLVLTKALGGFESQNLFLGFVEALLIICFWGLYGAALVFLWKGAEKRELWS